MDWHLTLQSLRDVLLILTSAVLISSSVVGILVAWQLYRLAKELFAAMQPIIHSVHGTTETMRSTADYYRDQLVSPTAGVVNAGLTARGLFQLVGEFYSAIKQDVPASLPNEKES